MKKLFLFLCVSTFVFFSCSEDDPIIDDESVVYGLDLPTFDANTEYWGDTENPVASWEDWGFTYMQTSLTDKSGVFSFDCISGPWGISNGFEFCNLTEGQNSAVTGKGIKNDTYVTSAIDSYSTTDVAIHFNEGKMDAPNGYIVKGLYVTNCTYAYDAMATGDEISNKFGDGDWFKLTIYSKDKTEKVEVLLADGTDILNEWKWVDLTALGETSGLKFELSSSDVGDWGMNTPAYFCLDGITLEEK